ncbi:MAG: hypothetical protein PHR84_01060 [Candidatus Omnitrophica bacterium]|nr:hypothetical protein [Candidatus Omnitrophota bacterium]MDD5660613.1 hypothetical protein [Candidatus Omnitrophota bacterium]
MKMRFVLSGILYLLVAIVSGCATIKEAGKGFIGVSTQVLEDKRKDAIKKSFALSYNDCYLQVKDILSKQGQESVIYAIDQNKKMIAVYLSLTDTTPVGIFFTEEAGSNTLIEISSPSTYAKEEIANRIFSGIGELIKPKVSQEKISDVK